MTHRIRTQITALTTIATTLEHRLPRPWPTRLTTHINYLDRHIDNALDNLRTNTPDGWGTSTSGADIGTGSRSTGHTTSVEAALTGRLNQTNHGKPIGTIAACDQLEAHLRDAATHIQNAIDDPATAPTRCATANDRLKDACNIVDHWVTTELDLKKRLTCGCGTLTGWLEWGDPLCENIAAPARAGLCDDCHRRRETWRVRIAQIARKQAQHR